jgi:hypothetical protein
MQISGCLTTRDHAIIDENAKHSKILEFAGRDDVKADPSARTGERKQNVPLSTVTEEFESNNVAIPLMRGVAARKSIY